MQNVIQETLEEKSHNQQLPWFTFVESGTNRINHKN